MSIFEHYLNQLGEIGYAEEINGPIIIASGLPNAMENEIVIFETGELGQIFTIQKENIEILLLSKNHIKPGTKIARTNKNLEAPINESLLGTIVNPLTLIENSIKPENKDMLLPIFALPKGITERNTISKTLETGVSIVDLAIPLAKGQRQLVIGDRKTGKSAFLLQTAMTQALKGTICIYAAIGKKTAEIKKIEEFFTKNNITNKTIIVASSSEEASGITNLIPYLSMTIAEYFKDKENDVLLILDDLTTHAKIYREISLLAQKFPGRNSYPADTFYMHAKLLERAGFFANKDNSVAITCLPVAETAQGDLSGYIPTNLMSITDGHLFFDSNLFTQGRRPAINPFLSVTRVGRQTQSRLRHDIGSEVISFLNLVEKMQNFVHFGAELNQNIKSTLDVGNKIIRFFNQPMGKIIPANMQSTLFALLWNNSWGNKEYGYIEKDMNTIITRYNTNSDFKTAIDKYDQINSFEDLLRYIKNDYQQIITL